MAQRFITPASNLVALDHPQPKPLLGALTGKIWFTRNIIAKVVGVTFMMMMRMMKILNLMALRHSSLILSLKVVAGMVGGNAPAATKKALSLLRVNLLVLSKKPTS